jgi:hypothetical protein
MSGSETVEYFTDPFWTDPETLGAIPSADQGEASLIFFYMGDSRFTTLFQETTRLQKAMKGYDKSVLLKHNLTPESIFSLGATGRADVQKEPTRENLVDQLGQLADEGYVIDLYIFSHGGRSSGFKLSQGSHGSEEWFGGSDIEGLASGYSGDGTGYLYLPLRLVYQVNCWGSNLTQNWINAGAMAATGPRYVNFFPTQFGTFADKWRQGYNVRDSIDKSDTAASRTVVHTALATGDAPATKGQWGGCPVVDPEWPPWESEAAVTILGDHSCARDYYIDRWGHNSNEWTNGKSGKWNINNASQQQIRGNSKINRTVGYKK